MAAGAFAGDTLVEFANEGHDTVLTTLTHFTLLSNFEDLKYSGTADFTGTGNGGANLIQGGDGSDHLYRHRRDAHRAHSGSGRDDQSGGRVPGKA